MNKAQKIIITIYFLLSFGVLLYAFLSYPPTNYPLVDNLAGIGLVLLVFGIPVFILYFLWRDKKIKEEKP